uniref:Metalloendopeptidase n=1 Tax=Phallusia mammillata TaxID=59560 RepID=A0A6F9DFU3_9ASCI|nr:uncharacterized protein LOC100176732 [Phallusia mammillata]
MIFIEARMWESIQGGSVEKAVTIVFRRWDDRTADGLIRIPFYVTPDIEMSEKHMNSIIAGLGVLNAVSCVKFEPATPYDRNVIKIFKGVGCLASVGMQGDTQKMSLSDTCPGVGMVEHEAMHALGIWHEQSRPDRDDYVKILEENIIPGQETNFYKFSKDQVESFSSPYDFGSIMHYYSTTFSKNGERTIER